MSVNIPDDNFFFHFLGCYDCIFTISICFYINSLLVALYTRHMLLLFIYTVTLSRKLTELYNVNLKYFTFRFHSCFMLIWELVFIFVSLRLFYSLLVVLISFIFFCSHSWLNIEEWLAKNDMKFVFVFVCKFPIYDKITLLCVEITANEKKRSQELQREKKKTGQSYIILCNCFKL